MGNTSAVPKPLRFFDTAASACSEAGDMQMKLSFEKSNLLYIVALGA